MELPVGQASRKDFWLSHIKAAERFEGTAKEYCRLNGISPGSLSSYKTQMGFSKKAPKNGKSNFSSVQVINPSKKKPQRPLPDPKWLAEFLKAWED